MKNKMIAVSMMALTVAMASIPAQTTFASEDKVTTSESGSKESGKEKMEAVIEKWNSLSKEKKEEVYKILEEEQAVETKLLDKFVSLKLLDADDVKQMKEESKERLAKIKESGKLPLKGKRPPKEGCKEKNNQ